MRTPRLLRSLLTGLSFALLAATPAWATWSIVLVNPNTGEIAVASATCLAGFDLEAFVPVIRVGYGGAAAQSVVDSGAVNRKIIWRNLVVNVTPENILEKLVNGPGTLPEQRQYGIAAFSGPAVTFTGSTAGGAATGVTGEVDGLCYAIQGNLLTGEEVVFAARDALVNTIGDVGQRVMAAMEAARSFGGDGRCSCGPNAPQVCGSPPPSFEKSAHVGFLIVARMGDTNGLCQAQPGCATGDYYLDLNVIGNGGTPDPVITLRERYDAWRADMAGRPDHVLSRVLASARSMPADGLSETTVVVKLVDLDGAPLTAGGATVEVTPEDPAATPLTTVGPVVDDGDGTYRFTVTAGTAAGDERLVISADDGTVKATLYPYLDLRLDPVEPLHAGQDEIVPGNPFPVPFVLDDPGAPGAPFFLLGSASGTAPGIGIPFDVGELVLPLNPDEFFWHTVTGGPDLHGTRGQLDAQGRAEALWSVTPAVFSVLAGRRIDWSALILGGVRVTNAVGFDVTL